jgi:hypothetical protein
MLYKLLIAVINFFHLDINWVAAWLKEERIGSFPVVDKSLTISRKIVEVFQ